MNKINSGVWPVMMTPFDENGMIDYEAVKRLVDWYIENGVAGIFAVCQSSEMFNLTESERVELGKFVTDYVGGRVGVVVSGHVSEEISDQIKELSHMAECGADALVLVSNRLAKQDEGDEVFMENLRKIMDALPDAVFGVYECPYPYRRLLTDEQIKFMADSGRFAFVKDVSCDVPTMKRRVELVNGSDLSLFNANCATILESLRFGMKGFCGVMSNIHPDLYEFICSHPEDERADKIADMLGICSLIETRCYPLCAKRYLDRYEGVTMEEYCRKDTGEYWSSFDTELEMVYRLTEKMRSIIK